MFEVELLARHHERSAFCCGVDDLDRYLQHQAGQDMRRHLAAVYVRCDEGTSTVIGYYTLSSFAVEFDDLPEELGRRLGAYAELPATLIGRLAADRAWHGTGLGRRLLMSAFERILASAAAVASALAVVYASDLSIKPWYERFGFISLLDDELHLALPIQSIAKLVGQTGHR